MRFCILFSIFAVFAFSTVTADDVLAPDWRGGSWSTTEEWDWAAYNPGYEPDGANHTAWLAPDVVSNNAYGQSAGQIALHPGDGTIPTGEWQMFPFGPVSGAGWWYGLTAMHFNVDTANPGLDYTQIRVQVAFGAVGPHGLSQTIYAVMDGNQYSGTVSSTIAGAGTKQISAVDFLIPGNSDEVDLYFQWNRAGFVDQVVIDTLATSVPEPASFLFFSGSAILIRRTWRKKS